MKLPKHVVDNGGGNLWFRIAIPADLRHHFDKRTAIKENLNTTDPKIAEERAGPYRTDAKRRFNELRSASGKKLHSKQEPAPIKLTSISQATLKYLAYGWLVERDGLSKHQFEVAQSTGELRGPKRDDIIQVLMGDRAALERPDDLQMLSHLQKEAKALLKGEGYKIGKKAPEYHDLVELLRLAEIEVINRSLQRYQGKIKKLHFNPMFEEPSRSIVAAPPEKDRVTITLGEVVEQYRVNCEEHGPQSGNKKNTYQIVFNMLIDLYGPDLPFGKFDRSKIEHFRDFISSLPKHVAQKYPGRSYREIHELSKRGEVETNGPDTKNSYLVPLKGMMKFAYKHGYVDDQRLTWIDKFVIKKSDQNTITAFTNAELETLFDPIKYPVRPNFSVMPLRTTELRDASKYLIPLLCLYTGARLNEICQLLVEDVFKVGSVWIIDHVDEEEDGKKLKNEPSRRRVPIHSKLKKIGFLDYVMRLQNLGERRLFPTFKTDKYGYWSGSASKWFARYRKSVGLTQVGGGTRRFRHTFRTALDDADVPLAKAQMLGGWQRTGSTDKRYITSMSHRDIKAHEDMDKYIEVLSFDCIDELLKRDQTC